MSYSRRRRRGASASWAALAAGAIALCAVLACWHARRNGQTPSVSLTAPEAAPANVAAVTPTPDPVAPPSEPAAPEGAAVLPAPQPDSSMFDACKQAYARHRSKEVLVSCERAFADNPRSAQVAVMLAKTEFDRGHSRQALDWAKQALALDEHQADAYVFLGGAEQARGHVGAAMAAYKHYLELSPKGRYAADLRMILGASAGN